MTRIRLLRLFENIETTIENINLEIFENLDPFESIAGGECHDVALIAFTYAKDSGFLERPRIRWTDGHAWVEGEYQGLPVIFDIVAVNQTHLGEPFSLRNRQEEGLIIASDSAEEYESLNPRCQISPEAAEYGAEELSFLNKFIIGHE